MGIVHLARPGPNLGSGAHAAGFSEAKGAQPSRRSVAPLGAVAHERLPDADEAETTKARWRARLIELKTLLES